MLIEKRTVIETTTLSVEERFKLLEEKLDEALALAQEVEDLKDTVQELRGELETAQEALAEAEGRIEALEPAAGDGLEH